eukprot:scaffold23197_cov67-Skeletonema_dohrnii-CCMP3373.AAC.1
MSLEFALELEFSLSARTHSPSPTLKSRAAMESIFSQCLQSFGWHHQPHSWNARLLLDYFQLVAKFYIQEARAPSEYPNFNDLDA